MIRRKTISNSQGFYIFKTIMPGRYLNGGFEGTWDIVINGSGVTIGVNDIHLDKGMIYSASPTPFNDRVEIKYGVFQKAKISLFVYDIQGNIVANLDE